MEDRKCVLDDCSKMENVIYKMGLSLFCWNVAKLECWNDVTLQSAKVKLPEHFNLKTLQQQTNIPTFKQQT